MSGCFWRRSKGDSNGYKDDVDEQEEKWSEITSASSEKEHNKRNSKRVFGGYRSGVSKVKNAVLFPFREFRKIFKRSLSSSSSASSRKNSSLSIGKRRIGRGLFLCVCLSKPQVLENNPSQGNSDPDDPEEFSYEYLKSMIEKNDFYSKECNTHFVD